MSKTQRTVRRAFVAAPSRIPIDVIRSVLRERDVEPITAYELPEDGRPIVEIVRKGIVESDLVVAVVDDSSGNVFFELGLAYGLGKKILAIVSPNLKEIPADISWQFYVRARPDNRQAISFALDQLLAAQPRSSKSRSSSKQIERPLGKAVDRYMSLLSEVPGRMKGADFEKLVVGVLEESGLSSVTASSAKDRGADIAVWSDDLESVVGNPFLIEVGKSIRNSNQLWNAISQLEDYRKNSGSKWSLLILPPLSMQAESTNPNSAVLTISISELLESLRSKTFSQTIRELRNARVHGGVE